MIQTAPALGSGAAPAAPADRPAAPAVPRWVLAPAAAALILLPFLHPSGPGNTSPVDVVIVASIVATVVWAVRSGVRLHAPYAVAVAVIVVAGCIGGIAGPFPSTSLLQVFQDLYLFVWMVCLVNIARFPGSFRTLLRAWSGGAMAWAAILIPAYFLHISSISGVTPAEGPRASLLAGDPNLLATYFVVSILITVATGFPSDLRLRVAGLALLCGGLALTFSNGGLISMAIATAVVLIALTVRRLGVIALIPPVAAVVLVLGGAVLAGVTVSGVQSWARNSGQPLLVDTLGRSGQSAWERATLFQESIDLYHQDGWLGLGPLATKSELQAELAPYINEAHDDYFAAVIERGLLGGLGMVLLIAALGLRVRSLLRAETRPPFLAAVRCPEALAAAVLAMAFFATNEEIFHFRQVWALFAVVAAYHLWAVES